MKHIGKYAKSVCLIAICVALLFSAFGCEPKEIQSGDIEGEVKVEGTVKVCCPQDVYSSDANRASVRQWLSTFKSMYPEVKIKEEFSDRGNWSARLSAKDMGDVFWLDDSQVYDMAVTNKSLMPLDSYAEHFTKDANFGLNISDVFSGIYNLGEADGCLYMVATNCGPHLFTYNKGMLTQAGLEMPTDDWTWSDFKDYIQKLTLTGPDGSLTQVGAAMKVNWDPMFVPFFFAYGGQWCDTVNKKVNLTTDENVLKGVEEFVSVIQTKQIFPWQTGISLGDDYSAAFANINNNNVISTAAFWHLDHFANLAARAAQYEEQGIEWDVVAFPLFDYPATPCGTFGYGVFSYTSNPAAAAALVLSIYTQAGQKAINQGVGGAIPLLSSLKEETFWHMSSYPDKNYGAFVANSEQYVTALVRCQVPAAVASIVEDGMAQLFKDLYSGSVSVEDSLSKIETQANEKWSTLK
ncbi:MAG: extracellular solute-binding protein [Clostridia bacterium]|nr:extracellular solute-binding protein [Clostridia bacterium]